jgi:NAD(P)H dehydrogenase (quinone)
MSEKGVNPMKPILIAFISLMIPQPAMVLAEQSPVRILITYFSQTGNTEKLAQAIGDGAKSAAGVEVSLRKMADVKDDILPSFDGIVVGTPVHFANLSTESRRFIDRLGAALAKTKAAGSSRTAGVFCTGGEVSLRKDIARLSLMSSLFEMRFIIIGGVTTEGYGTLGPEAATGPADPGLSDKELEEGRRFGERFARLTRQLLASR